MKTQDLIAEYARAHPFVKSDIEQIKIDLKAKTLRVVSKTGKK